MNTWILALKEWNSKQTGKYRVPKKGSPEYEQIKRIQMKMSKTLSAPKNEFDDNVKLYKRTKKNIKEANATYEATRPLQKQTIQNLKKANSAVGKFSGGSLQKALTFANRNPADFVKLVNQQQSGSGLKKHQKGGFLPAFIIPFIPAITSALGAFATGAAGAAGAYAVDEILGDGLSGGEIIDPKVDIIKSLDSFWKEITGSGLSKKQVKNIKIKTQHGGNWWDIARALNTLNNFMIQPPPTIDTETGEVVVRSGFDMI